jgi:DNA-binding MarR family transcriptional regulator
MQNKSPDVAGQALVKMRTRRSHCGKRAPRLTVTMHAILDRLKQRPASRKQISESLCLSAGVTTAVLKSLLSRNLVQSDAEEFCIPRA